MKGFGLQPDADTILADPLGVSVQLERPEKEHDTIDLVLIYGVRWFKSTVSFTT
jgi:hypothetical protein